MPERPRSLKVHLRFALPHNSRPALMRCTSSSAVVLAVAIALLIPESNARAQDGALALRADSVFGSMSGPLAPGCAVDVRRGDQTLLSRAWGVAELEHGAAITPATIFEAGSVSKQVTAAAVLLLEARGALSLNDTLQRWFPEIPVYEEPITLRHLMQHTSGLRDWGAVAQLEGWPRGTRDHRQEHALTIASRQRALNHPPSAEFSYTNTGYNLLAILVHRVSGVSFAEFTRREFFAPLGMTATSWRDDPSRLVAGRAQAYSPTGTGGWRLDMPFEHVHGNGGLLTTVGDLQRWTNALASGNLRDPSVSTRMQDEGRLRDGAGAGYGGGLFLGDVYGVRAVYHGGATAGYRAFLARFVDADIRVAVLCNRGDASPQVLARRLLDGTLPFVSATPSTSAPIAPVRVAYDSTTFAEFAGVYTSDEAAARWTIRAGGSGLTFARWSGDIAPLRAVGNDQFAGPAGLRVLFTRDASGAVIGFTADVSRALGVIFTRE